jgi:hypothetical protein
MGLFDFRTCQAERCGATLFIPLYKFEADDDRSEAEFIREIARDKDWSLAPSLCGPDFCPAHKPAKLPEPVDTPPEGS